MLTDYIQAAMRRAHYEILPESGTIYGNISGLQGVWAEADTLEACREELQGVLEDWLVLGLRRRDTIPILDGIDLNSKQGAA